MNGLYKRVLKGQYAPIDKTYSINLNKVLRNLLQVDSSKRPSCAQILQTDFIREKCE